MKNNKGISMITLIVTIIVMIIFLGLAYRTGVRYILTSKEEQKTAFISVMSGAVNRRQNDNYIGLSGITSYYSGYHMSSGEYNDFTPYFEEDYAEYEPGLWYILDAKSAKELGVVDADTLLVKDLSDEDPSDESGKYVAVVDYFTGEVHLIEAEPIVSEAVDIASKNIDEQNGHQHHYLVATCTEPSICEECGAVISPALGHDYNGMVKATCTEDLKCIRCGYIAEKATGHDYDESQWEHDEGGHYHYCKNECGTKVNYSPHTFGEYKSVENSNPWEHNATCTTCGYVETSSCHIEIKAKDTVSHTLYCADCLREEDVEHDDLKYRYVDKDTHILYCNTCKADIREENHTDVQSPYGICDNCNGVIDMTRKPNYTVSVVKKEVDGVSNNWANINDTIIVTITSDTMLAKKPTIRMQNILIDSNSIDNQETLKWVATINLSNYSSELVEGELVFDIKEVRSLWGVVSDDSTINSGITLDTTRPTFEIIY